VCCSRAGSGQGSLTRSDDTDVASPSPRINVMLSTSREAMDRVAVLVSLIATWCVPGGRFVWVNSGACRTSCCSWLSVLVVVPSRVTE
jgi:hypothetical protein